MPKIFTQIKKIAASYLDIVICTSYNDRYAIAGQNVVYELTEGYKSKFLRGKDIEKIIREEKESYKMILQFICGKKIIVIHKINMRASIMTRKQ